MKYKILIFFLLFLSASCQQKDPLNDFLEDRNTGLILHFYPSTLRMINIDQNEEYNKMIREVEKARFIRLDSGQFTKEEISELITSLQSEGYEEVMSFRDKKQDISVLAMEKKIPEFVMLSRAPDQVMILEMKGMVNVAKIPKLTQTFSENGFLNVLDLYGNKKKK